MTEWTKPTQSTDWVGTNVLTTYDDPLTEYNQPQLSYGGSSIWTKPSQETTWSKP